MRSHINVEAGGASPEYPRQEDVFPFLRITASEMAVDESIRDARQRLPCRAGFVR